MNELYIVNYCNPNCKPLFSITRLPEAEAFKAAKELSKNSGTSFGRFADFENYYPKRMRTEKWLYDWFTVSGGEPKTKHPLYFVLQGSSYLNEWFGNGRITRLPLSGISPKHISFTFGDSMARMDKPERRDPFGKEALYKWVSDFNGTAGEFFNEIDMRWRYIEVQLWCDEYAKDMYI